MTDAEIVKALECCKSFDDLRACYKCPALENGDCSDGKVYISNFILDNTLDLINRQKAEIEKLERAVSHLEDYANSVADKVKAEAIKEFAEKLKCRSHRFKTIDRIFVDCIPLDYIDKLVKEVVGE